MYFSAKIPITLVLIFPQSWILRAKIGVLPQCVTWEKRNRYSPFLHVSFLKRKNTSKSLLYTILTILFPPQKWVKFCRNNDHSFAKRKWEENHEKKHLPKGRFCFSGDIFSALLYQYTDKNKNRTGCQNSCGQDMQYWHFLIKHGHLSTETN